MCPGSEAHSNAAMQTDHLCHRCPHSASAGSKLKVVLRHLQHCRSKMRPVSQKVPIRSQTAAISDIDCYRQKSVVSDFLLVVEEELNAHL